MHAGLSAVGRNNKVLCFDIKERQSADKVAKYLLFTLMNLGKYLTKHYALWLDLRTTDDNLLHGSGRAVLNASKCLTIQITKKNNKKQMKL